MSKGIVLLNRFELLTNKNELRNNRVKLFHEVGFVNFHIYIIWCDEQNLMEKLF